MDAKAGAIRVRAYLLLAIAVFLPATVGCDAPPGGPGAARAADTVLEPNIIKVVPFYGQDPFGTVGGGTKTNGFVVQALYLVAPTKSGEEGVFGDGIIHVTMHVIEHTGDKTDRRLVREWLFDPEQAKPYRTKKRYVGGYGYQLHCAWGDADVLGKRVEIEVSFERKDGRVVHSRPRSFTVPRI